ncbi:MAG: adenylate/guanylate cyclase domain-containing protein, partial [Candidatus Tectomicrobia bacterium]|nr:adenylate/guanylate cyclase domain-containing protein [Candidatus Tectomicrobia bacterium]
MGKGLKKLFQLSGFKAGLFLTGAAILVFLLRISFLDLMELKALDLKFLSRGQQARGNEVVIAVIDEKSLDRLGRWPWPRSLMAKLIDKLVEAQVRVIGFDVVFSESEVNPDVERIRRLEEELKGLGPPAHGVAGLVKEIEAGMDNDGKLARAIRESERTVLGYFFHFSGKELSHADPNVLAAAFDNIRPWEYNAVRYSSRRAMSYPLPQAFAAEASIQSLSVGAAGAGYFNFKPDEDGAIRWLPLVVRYRDREGKDYLFPPLSFEILRKYLNQPIRFFIRENYGVERAEIGSIRIPVNENGAMLINYRGGPQTFPHYSIVDILEGRVLPATLKDKIILVGPTATGIYDIRVTPVASIFPGVEIHANVIDNILHRRFLQKPGWMLGVEVFLIAALGFLLSSYLPHLRPGFGALLAFVVTVGYILINDYLFQAFGLWVNLVYPVLGILMVYVGITVYNFVAVEKKRRFIQGAFGQYVAPQIISQIVENPDRYLRLGGEKKNLTALFSDIRNFTTISEKMAPEELVESLNDFLTEMTDIIMEYQGTVDKYVGDAIVAFFGAPIDYEDHARRACLAALEMQERSGEIRRRWAEQGRPELFIRIGLNTGPMVVGNIGSRRKMNYSIIGDAVNLASRLEGTNKEYVTRIIAGASTVESVRDFVEVRELDVIRVVGKTEPVSIYEVLAKKG